MASVKVWLGGEGPNEIGDRNRNGGTRRGALEALLLRLEEAGWEVAGGAQWKSLRRYRAGAARGKVSHEDERNVIKLALQAKERGCEVVAFSRDVDVDHRREEAVDEGIEKAQAAYEGLAIIGGVAKPAIEGWILALHGIRDTDRLSRAKAKTALEEQDVSLKSTEDYVAVAETADLEKLPSGCDSLCTWIRRAREELGAAIRGRKPL
jgi:hypothetical protein